jgi:hypothetical protein
MIVEKKAANAMGGKTARACDSCLRRRARWFCAADDAFLCQACDASVHSANQLASRHERVRLQTSSFKLSTMADNSPPAWHQGFTRKARTPRHNKAKEEERVFFNPLPFVPEIGSEEASPDAGDDEQLLYRVPVFDPFAAELCNEMGNVIVDERTTVADHDLDDLHGLNLPSDMELAEFAADVESLLGKGLLDCKEEDDIDLGDQGRVKVEEEEDFEAIVAYQLNPPLDMMRETLDWNLFDYESSPGAGEEAEQKPVVPMAETKMMINGKGCKEEIKREMFLRLNYEEVITAWASQGSPWAAGTRPELNPNDWWPDFLVLFPPSLSLSLSLSSLSPFSDPITAYKKTKRVH